METETFILKAPEDKNFCRRQLHARSGKRPQNNSEKQRQALQQIADDFLSAID